MRHRSQVVARRTVAGEFPALRSALLDSPANWLPGLLASAAGSAIRLEAETRFGHLSREARIEVGAPALTPASVSLPISWRSSRAEALFPVLNGQLRLYHLAGGSTRLEVRGEYAPPAGWIGQAADRVLLHTIAQATVANFVDRVVAVLDQGAAL